MQDSKAPLTATLYPVLLLCVLCLSVYANSLWGEFAWDDSLLVVRNESIRSLENIPEMLTSRMWSFAGSSTATNRYYRPVPALIYAIVYHFVGLSPFGYHLANVLLHTAATLVVYAFCRELRIFGTASLLPAALFAVHPVHTEAVASIAATSEVACGLFYFMALWGFLRYWTVRRVGWLVLSAAAFFIALLSKEAAVTLPVAALLVVLMKRDELRVGVRKIALSMAPFFVTIGVYGMLRLWVVGAGIPSTLRTEASILDWITLGLWLFGQYVRYAFVPYPLTPFHLTSLHLADRMPSSVLYMLLIAGTATLLYFMRHRMKTAVYWAGMFVVTLAPVFYLKGITGGFMFAERYLYMPTLPAMALLALLVLQLPRDFLVAAVASLVAAFSFATVLQNRAWDSDKALFARSATVYPENSYAWVNLGGMYLNEGNDAQAQQAFEMAGRHIASKKYLQPSHTEYLAELGLGTMAARRGLSPEAKTHLERALALNPAGENAYSVLAGVLINLDSNFDAAIPLLEKAIALNPVDDQARDSLGVAFFQKGQYEKAAGHFREALRINPQSQLAKQHLAIALGRISGNRDLR
jgi:Tfp pilus assembly protein PilF